MILTYVVIALITFIFYVKWRHSYWQRKGVPTIEPEFFFGHFRPFVTKKISPGEFNLNYYRALKKIASKHAGLYFFLTPIYVVLDLDLIKKILQKDFVHFMGHGMYHHPKDILTMHLFNLEGERWKDLRAKLTPTFTSGKMKMMFETLLKKTVKLEEVVSKYATNDEPFAIKDVSGRFTTDIIGSCAFGIECNSMEEPDSVFRKYGTKILTPNSLRFWLVGILPWKLIGYLGFKTNGPEVTNFFVNVVENTIKTRAENNIYRKDFMQLLLELKNGTASTRITKDDIIAQCFVFFLAGFETSSTTMTFALLELAQNQEIQEKTREEVVRVLNKHDGKITYEGVMEMLYLEKVINETLRKYPPVSSLPRTCTKTYKVPGTDVVIEKGTRVQIPVWGIHMDPEYYPDPEVFDPERFSDDASATRPDFTHLPFGEGPRMCIGLRFGMLQTKMGIASLLKNFKFTLNKKTQLPIKMAPKSLVISVEGEVWLNASRI